MTERRPSALTIAWPWWSRDSAFGITLTTTRATNLRIGAVNDINDASTLPTRGQVGRAQRGRHRIEDLCCRRAWPGRQRVGAR